MLLEIGYLSKVSKIKSSDLFGRFWYGKQVLEQKITIYRNNFQKMSFYRDNY